MSGRSTMVRLARLARTRITTCAAAASGIGIVSVLATAAAAWLALRSAGAPAGAVRLVELVTVLSVAAAISGALLARRCVRGSLVALAAESRRVTEAVSAGRVDVRYDVSALAPEYQPLVAGINDALDAFIAPILIAAGCVERLSRGDIPAPLTEEFQGEFEVLRGNLNQCIGAVNALVRDVDALAGAAVEGKLGTRADPRAHAGDFCRIVEGVNRTLDATTAPITEARSVLERLARRDLRARVVGEYRGDHANVKEAVNETADALQSSIAEVARAVERVSLSASDIAAASEAVANGASAQASALSETSTSLESMEAMTRRSAESAGGARDLANAARDAAHAGMAAIEHMTGAMTRIKAAAEGTSQIIKDINEISFQTNLLALNAAVEAARAGEAGRGFAVVAEEVRALALRSKEAARKTEDLIHRSVQEASEGAVTARAVTGRLGEITGAVEKVTGIVAEIAAGANEQASGIGELNRAVAQVGGITQQNAANAQGSSSAASALSTEAGQLAEMVATFELEENRPADANAACEATAGFPEGGGRAKRATHVIPAPASGNVRARA